jgi:hypothetical protein
VNVEITAINGYGTFSDMGTIRILVESEFDKDKSTQVECLGFIYQLKLDNTGPVDEYSDYYTPTIVGETPEKNKITNDGGVPGGVRVVFDGYPDYGARYVSAVGWYGLDVPDLQEVFLVSETYHNVHTGLGAQTPIVIPYSFGGLREGWEWVTEWTYTEGECGADLSNAWSEQTFHDYPSWPGPQPNTITIEASLYGSWYSYISCGMAKPGGVHYAGGFHITGEVWVPGNGWFTYGCSRDGANWAYDDVGISMNDMLAHGYQQAQGCIGTFQEELTNAYNWVLSQNPDIHESWYKEFSDNYVGNPFKNSKGRGLILQGGWKFVEKDIELQMGATGFGEVSLFMIPRSAKNMDFSLSQAVIDAGNITYGTPDHAEFPVGFGTLFAGNSQWTSNSTLNDNFVIDSSYESSSTQRFGIDIVVERGIHKVLLTDDRGGEAVCWALMQLTDKDSVRMVWNIISFNVQKNDNINFYVGEMPIDMYHAAIWKTT